MLLHLSSTEDLNLGLSHSTSDWVAHYISSPSHGLYHTPSSTGWNKVLLVDISPYLFPSWDDTSQTSARHHEWSMMSSSCCLGVSLAQVVLAVAEPLHHITMRWSFQVIRDLEPSLSAQYKKTTGITTNKILSTKVCTCTFFRFHTKKYKLLWSLIYIFK